MNVLKLKFENCYGLKKFEHDFNFADCCTQVIYAPNGAMKSSFAKIFDDLSNDKAPSDRIFKARIPVTQVRCNDDDSELPKENIFVIERYKEEIKYERVSTLLVNQELKDEYDNILNTINDKKDHLIKNLENHSGLKNIIPKELSNSFNKNESDFLDCLVALEEQVNDEAAPLFPEIIYKEIYNDKVVTFLGTKDFKSKLDDYLDTYDELISKSTYFKKGVFTHNNADTISKSLKENGFFKASHTVSLNSEHGKKEVANQEELEQEIQSEKNKILTDEALSKKFMAMDTAITKNSELKNFRSYLENNPEIRPELRNLEAFKQKLWLSYLKQEAVIFNELLALYKDGKIEISRIVEQAKAEEAEWKAVVKNFNERFDVPYRLLVKNQDEVILNNAVPSIIFEYVDGDETVEIGGADLIEVLSTGEQRALYLLNIFFEIENRKKLPERSLIIIDDIADSFDYRNKYAIVEYLKDMIDCDKFRMIILTHNFDFFRTVIGRLSINKWTNCFLSIKTELGVKLVNGKDSIEVFSTLKSNYHANTATFIAAIPFVRNLIEYTQGTTSSHYNTLTGLLHSKTQRGDAPDVIKATIDIKITDVEQIFSSTFGIVVPIPEPDKAVYELIMELADALCLENADNINIENKIILSIAIRLKAEVFMIQKINDIPYTSTINKHQTAKLFKRFCTDFPLDSASKSVLNRVNIMTPENIHLNSFMYEPILDLSDTHLKALYSDVNALFI